MAVKLEKTTDSKKVLKIISVTDSSIDWDDSYPDAEDLEEEEEIKKIEDDNLPVVTELVDLTLEERKKAHYSKHHDETKLRFKKDDIPTLFIFAHPHRVDVSRKMREIASNMYSDSQRGKKDKVEKDMFTSVFHYFYLGMEQGFSGERETVQRINGRITDDIIQALEDAEVFIELNSAFMRVYNQDRYKNKDKNHQEK